jgi:hypothetical protein
MAKITGCPMDPSWRSWDVWSPERTLAGAVDGVVCRQAQAMQHGAKLSEQPVLWEVAPDDAEFHAPAGDAGFVDGSPSHRHAEFAIDGQQVHIDCLVAHKWGPSRFYVEYRIFVDGVLAGRGGESSLPQGGASDRDLPAVALFGQDRVLTVDGHGMLAVWKRAGETGSDLLMAEGRGTT